MSEKEIIQEKIKHNWALANMALMVVSLAVILQYIETSDKVVRLSYYGLIVGLLAVPIMFFTYRRNSRLVNQSKQLSS